MGFEFWLCGGFFFSQMLDENFFGFKAVFRYLLTVFEISETGIQIILTFSTSLNYESITGRSVIFHSNCYHFLLKSFEFQITSFIQIAFTTVFAFVLTLLKSALDWSGGLTDFYSGPIQIFPFELIYTFKNKIRSTAMARSWKNPDRSDKSVQPALTH